MESGLWTPFVCDFLVSEADTSAALDVIMQQESATESEVAAMTSLPPRQVDEVPREILDDLFLVVVEGLRNLHCIAKKFCERRTRCVTLAACNMVSPDFSTPQNHTLIVCKEVELGVRFGETLSERCTRS